MTTHGSSAPERHATPHATNSTTNQTISNAVKRRAHALINDRTIDPKERVWIRYALETNDAAGLAELVRRADAGEPISMIHTCWKLLKRFQQKRSSNVWQR